MLGFFRVPGHIWQRGLCALLPMMMQGQRLPRVEVSTDASHVRPGMLVDFESKIWEVKECGSRKCARGRANTTLDLRELGPDGRKKSLTLRTVDTLEVVELELLHTVFVSAAQLDAEAKQKLRAGKPVAQLITVREEDTDEEMTVDCHEIGCAHLIPYMSPEMPITICSIEDRVVQLKLPTKVVCRVQEAEERDSKKGGTKPLVLENGRTLQGPRHISAGDSIVVELPLEAYHSKST